MYLQRIEIENFKSFGDRRVLEFALPSESDGKSGLTLLVGANNCGKTSVIDAMRLVCNDSNTFDRNQRRKDGLPNIVLARLGGAECQITKSDASSFGIKRTIIHGFDHSDIRIVSARRSWNSASDIGIHDDNAYWGTQNRNHDASNHPQLLGRLVNLDSDQEFRPRLTKILKDLIPNFGAWRLDRIDNQYVVEYSSAGGDWHRASLLGDGILNLFQLAIGILDMKDASSLVVDEPELSLHPQAQKTVARYLKKFSLSHQVIVATHSPYFLDFETILDGAALYRLELVNGMTNVHQLSPTLVAEFRDTMGDYQRPQLLDVVAKEMFFGEGVMFVEGQEDVGLFRKIARETERPELPVFGYGIGGASQIERFMKMAAELGIHCGALIDGTEKEKLPGLQREFPHFMIRALETDDIRDKEPQPAKAGREGIFTSAGELKSGHRESFLALYDEFSTFFANR